MIVNFLLNSCASNIEHYKKAHKCQLILSSACYDAKQWADADQHNALAGYCKRRVNAWTNHHNRIARLFGRKTIMAVKL